MKESKLNEGVLLLSKLAGYLDELGQERSASWFRNCADELLGELSRKQISDVCRGVLLSLDNGPGRIPDLYFAHPNGEPDIVKTEEYLETIRAVRRFARKGV
jgi:hypothetical protein